MKDITITKINMLAMTNIDQMGYTFNKNNASVHHLIIPRRLGGLLTYENTAVLNILTSHSYAHLIERVDLEIFNRITSEMIDENIKMKIDPYNLRKIDGLLTYFEREHCGERTNKGKLLIKEEYTRRPKI